MRGPEGTLPAAQKPLRGRRPLTAGGPLPSVTYRSQWGMSAGPLGVDSFPSPLFGTNAILELLVVAEVGLSCTPTTRWLREKGACFSGSGFEKYLGPELRERGEGVLDNELVDPSGGLEVTFPRCFLGHGAWLDHPVCS